MMFVIIIAIIITATALTDPQPASARVKLDRKRYSTTFPMTLHKMRREKRKCDLQTETEGGWGVGGEREE